MKTIRRYRRYTLLLFVSLLLSMTGRVFVVSGQETTPAPSAISQSTPQATSTSEAQDTQSIGSTIAGLLAGLRSNLGAGFLLDLGISALILLLAIAFGGKVVRVVFRWVKKRTKSKLDDLLFDTVRPQLIQLVNAIAFQIATARLDSYLSDFWQTVLQNIYFVLYLYIGSVIIWRLLDFSLDLYIKKLKREKGPGQANKLEPLARRTIHALIIIIASVTLLAHFGVNVLAITGALGLTGFAIGLAAKDTISNMISGVVIMVDNPFNIGNRIYVSTVGSWADVTEIGLRTTKVLTRDNRVVIVPNSTIVDGTVTNYSLPDPSYRLQTDIGIGSEEVVSTVVQVLTDAVRRVEGVLPDKSVDVLFTGFEPSSSTFRVRWWVASYTEKRPMSHRVNAAIQEAAQKAGIDMPNPTFALDGNIKIREEDAAGAHTA